MVLSDEELEGLAAETALVNRTPAPGVGDVRLAELLDEERLLGFLESFGERIKAPKLVVAAAQFQKHLAYTLTVPFAHSLSRYQQPLALHIDHVWIGQNDQGAMALILEPAAVRPREALDRETAARRLFADNLSLINQRLMAAAKVPELILWENIFGYLDWVYGYVLDAPEDFRYFVDEAPGSVFGKAVNPLRACNRKVRRTCCLYPQLPGVNVTCANCRLNPRR